MFSILDSFKVNRVRVVDFTQSLVKTPGAGMLW
jgi:hypothetical protein